MQNCNSPFRCVAHQPLWVKIAGINFPRRRVFIHKTFSGDSGAREMKCFIKIFSSYPRTIWCIFTLRIRASLMCLAVIYTGHLFCYSSMHAQRSLCERPHEFRDFIIYNMEWSIWKFISYIMFRLSWKMIYLLYYRDINIIISIDFSTAAVITKAEQHVLFLALLIASCLLKIRIEQKYFSCIFYRQFPFFQLGSRIYPLTF